MHVEYWLPVWYCFWFKLALLMHMVHGAHCPSYIRDARLQAAEKRKWFC